RFSRDWSSDVCSSDLVYLRLVYLHISTYMKRTNSYFGISYCLLLVAAIFFSACSKDDTPTVEPPPLPLDELYQAAISDAMIAERSEERRVGKGCRMRS